MRTNRKIRPGKDLTAELKRLSRKDFLRLGGAGMAGAAMLGTAGCGVFGGSQGGNGGGGGGGGGNSIAINLYDTIADLNSTTTTDGVSSDVLLNVMEGLYRLDENTHPQPAVAEGVEISDDQLSYTFTLRDGVKWSDGSAVTAKDFEYAWIRALDPDTAGQYAFIIGQFVEGGTEFNLGEGSREDVGIRATDDKTLEVQLALPAPFFLSLTSFYTYYPQKQSFTEEQGDDYAQSPKALLYNGPYTLTSFNPTQGVTLVKNDNYWNAENVDIQKVEARIVKELETAVNLYESGQLDVQVLNVAQYVEEYKDSPEFHAQIRFVTYYLSFNYGEPIFQNENIRRAFQTGYDRDALVNQIINDGSVSATGFVPEGMAANGGDEQTFREVQGPVLPEFDAEEAKKLFQQGVEEVGENPTIELLAYDISSSRDIATFLQDQFEKNLGAKVDVNVQPFDRKLELEADGEFQLSWQAWIGDYNDPMTFLDLYLSDNAFNTGKYANDRYDELITQAQEEPDAAARLEIMQEAERLLVEEDAGAGPMFFDYDSNLIKPNIKNFVDHPYGGGIDISLWRLEG